MYIYIIYMEIITVVIVIFFFCLWLFINAGLIYFAAKSFKKPMEPTELTMPMGSTRLIMPPGPTKSTKMMTYRNYVDDDVFRLYREYVMLGLIQENIQWTNENYEILRILIGLSIFLMNKSPSKNEIFLSEYKKLLRDIDIDTDIDHDMYHKYEEPYSDFITKVLINSNGNRNTKDEMISIINLMIHSRQHS